MATVVTPNPSILGWRISSWKGADVPGQPRGSTKEQSRMLGGTFTLLGIPPATYKLFAWKTSPDGAEQTPEFLSKFDSGGQTIIVGPGSSSEVHLQVIP